MTEGAVCQRIAERLACEVGHERFDRYFKDCASLELTGRHLTVFAPSPFLVTWLDSKFGTNLLQAARLETGDDAIDIAWKVDPARFGQHEAPSPEAAPQPEPAPVRRDERAAPAATSTSGRWSASTARRHAGFAAADTAAKLSLDTFVVGAGSRLAFEAASRLADGPHPGFSALFLHGECGVGKTHLLSGLAKKHLASKPGARVRWLTGEQFTNEFIAAVRGNGVEAFRSSLRRLDLLCIDDVHFLAGKAGTQQEFLHTFDTLERCGARVAMASDGHPRDIAQFGEHLVSRCLAGMVVRIDRPDDDTRRRIVRKLCADRLITLSDEALEMIASSCVGSVRDLEGVLTRVDAVGRLLPELGASGVVGAAVVRRVLGDSAVRMKRPIKVITIAEIVCRSLGVDLSEVLGRSRHKRVVQARSLTAHLARELTTQSYPEIAQAMNRPNHSTIVTACQRVQKQIDDGELCEDETGSARVPAGTLREQLKRAIMNTWS